MPRLVYRQAAIDSLEAIQDYIAADNPSRAVSFVSELQTQCRKLAALPGIHGRARPELRPDLRSFAFKGYVIFFRYAGDLFELMDVIEGHRDIDHMSFG